MKGESFKDTLKSHLEKDKNIDIHVNSFIVCKLFLQSITYLKCYKHVIKIIIFLENTIYWLTNFCVAAKQENFILINYFYIN